MLWPQLEAFSIYPLKQNLILTLPSQSLVTQTICSFPTSVTEMTFPPFTLPQQPGFMPEFWHSHEHVKPGYRACLQAGFQPSFATHLCHNRIVSVKKWRKKHERGLSARRGCFWRYGPRIESSVDCRGQ